MCQDPPSATVDKTCRTRVLVRSVPHHILALNGVPGARLDCAAMAEPYTAVGLVPTVWGVRKRADIQKNLDHVVHLIKAASWLSSLDLPVRLIAIPEGGLQAF